MTPVEPGPLCGAQHPTYSDVRCELDRGHSQYMHEWTQRKVQWARSGNEMLGDATATFAALRERLDPDFRDRGFERLSKLLDALVYTSWSVEPVVPAPPEKQPEEGRIYPCDDCGVMRTKAEGGTTFTICEECWRKRYGKPSVAASPAPAEPYEGLTESELVHIAVIERAERKRLETLPREVAKCRGHWHMMSCGDDLAYGGDVDIGSFSSAEAAMAGWDRYYEEESHILWLCEKLRALRSRAQSLPPEGEK